MARAKRTARAEARRRYRAEHPLEASEVEGAEDEADAEDAQVAPRKGGPARPAGSGAGGGPARPGASRSGALRAFRDAYQPADIRGDLRALPELIRSRAVTIPALLVVVSAVVLVLAVQIAPAVTGLTGASASPGTSATLAAGPSPSSGANAASLAPSPVASASPTPSSVAAGGAATVSGSPLGVIASIMALLFLGIPSPPAIGGIYLAAILAKRSSWLAGGIAGFLGSMGALAAVIAISPNQAGESIAVFAQILATSVVFGLVIGAGLGYYRRLLRLMNPTQNRPAARSKQPARRR